MSFITQQVRTELLVVPVEWRGFPHGAMARDLAKTSGFGVLEIDLAQLSAQASPEEIRLPAADPKALPPPPSLDGPRWVDHSSGTTADPKGARHTDFSIMSSANGLLDLMGLGETDVYPIPFPITHIGGAAVLASSLRGGVHLVLFENFESAETPRQMAVHQPTVLGTAVPFFRAYLDAASRQGDESLFPSLRFGCFGGAPVPREIHDEIGRRCSACPWWGAGASPNFPTPPLRHPTIPLRSSRRQLAGRPRTSRSAVIDANGDVCGSSQEGELVLRGPQCFSGYVDEALNDASIDADGWFHTGDLGSIDAAGNVRITGRLKDIIIRNAENISVLEVEDLLYRHPDVADVALWSAWPTSARESGSSRLWCGGRQ